MKKIFLIIVLFATGTFFSCEKNIEEEVVSGITSEHYATLDGLENGAKAAYSYLRSLYGTSFSVAYDLWFTGTDLGMAGRFPRPVCNYDVNFDARDGSVEKGWAALYKAINTCNSIIENAENLNDSDSKNQLVAEAKFLRGYYYFLLVQTWGDVHLTLEETKGVETEANRTPESQIYEQAIIPDLQFAIDNLPVQEKAFGRANKAAAEAIMCRVRMVREEWSEAEKLAKNVINNYDYELIKGYEKIWDLSDEQNSEIIWSAQFWPQSTFNDGGNFSYLLWTPWYSLTGGVGLDFYKNGHTWVRYKPTVYLLDLFDMENDIRYQEGFKFVWYINTNQGKPAGLAIGDTGVWVTNLEISDEFKASKLYKIYDRTDYLTDKSSAQWPQPIKMRDETRQPGEQCGRDQILIRIAEMYLNAAEALFMQGKVDEAVTYLNAVREKRAIPGHEDQMKITAADVDLDFILDDRGRELFLEGLRWFDLKRTGTLVERNTIPTANFESIGLIKEYHNYRPIPQAQIDRTSNDYPQNPGYPQ